jgi:hypothetical protein
MKAARFSKSSVNGPAAPAGLWFKPNLDDFDRGVNKAAIEHKNPDLRGALSVGSSGNDVGLV